MAYLQISIEPKGNNSKPEAKREAAVARIVKRHRNAEFKSANVRAILEGEGFELGPIIGSFPPDDWPLIAYVYVSPNRAGVGRGASSISRWPCRSARD